MYDFAAGGLHYFGKDSGGLYGPFAPYPAPCDGVPLILPFAPQDNIAHAVLKNHLFVLRSDGDSSSGFPSYNYYISEYVLEKNATGWVEVGRIDLPFDELSGFTSNKTHGFFLDACKGFLMLLLHHKQFLCHMEVGFIYNLSGGFWLELPLLQPRPANCRDYGPLDLMCELRWNATP